MPPALLRGAAVVTRLLHGNRRSRQAVRLVPGIVDGAAHDPAAAAGQPVGPVELGRALGAATNRVLGAGPARRPSCGATRAGSPTPGAGTTADAAADPTAATVGALTGQVTERTGAGSATAPGPAYLTIRRQPVRLGTAPGVRVRGAAGRGPGCHAGSRAAPRWPPGPDGPRGQRRAGAPRRGPDRSAGERRRPARYAMSLAGTAIDDGGLR